MSGAAPQARETGAGQGLAAAVARFVGLLREVGLRVGTGQTIDAVRALALVDTTQRDDVYAALRAVLLDGHGHEAAFHAAFDAYWRGLPITLERHRAPLAGYAPAERGGSGAEGAGPAARLPPLLTGDPAPERTEGGSSEQGQGEGLAYSAVEALRYKDFGQLSQRELAEMRRLLAGLAITLPPRRTRRTAPAADGPLLDLRRAARRSLKVGGEVVTLPRRRRRVRTRPLVVLCDVSGSMDRYSRLLLRFLYATSHGLRGVEAFVFSTRLTRITRQLRVRDPDHALDEVAREARDFSGGTRIGEALASFNRHWARRTLGHGALVLVISDGWDRGRPALLAAEMAHLQRSCHLLAWLNPLLGVAGYQPLTRGMSAALPYVDLFLPTHNLASLESLGALLGGLKGRHPARRRIQAV